jgi:hypothetical protein
MQELEQRMEQLPRSINDQELLSHMKAADNDSLGSASSKQFGECCQKMGELRQQALHGRVE